MISQTCSSAGCYLSKNGGLVSFPLVTLAGLIDGINPCAIGILLTLLGSLIVFAKKKELVWKIGLGYILSVYFTYLILGIFFYKSMAVIDTFVLKSVVNKIFGSVFIIYGFLRIKDFLSNSDSVVSQRVQNMVRRLTDKISLPATIMLGVFVTLVETPCSLPLYVGTVKVLSMSGLSPFVAFLYFAYYNLLFILPLVLVLIIMGFGRDTMWLREAQHVLKKWMRLIMGVILIILGGWIFIF